MEKLGYEVSPKAEEPRYDIIQTIAFGAPDPLRRFCAVSYTHLDVYKRQPPQPPPDECRLCRLDGVHDRSSRRFAGAVDYEPQQPLSEVDQLGILQPLQGPAGRFVTVGMEQGVNCLLYTSRCV